MTSEGLLACPFCGGAAVLIQRPGASGVRCRSSAHFIHTYGGSEADAIAAWNRRTPQVEAGDLATAARALLAANDRVVTAMVECATEDEALRLAMLGGDAFSDTLEPLRRALTNYTAMLSAAPAPEGTE